MYNYCIVTIPVYSPLVTSPNNNNKKNDPPFFQKTVSPEGEYMFHDGLLALYQETVELNKASHVLQGKDEIMVNIGPCAFFHKGLLIEKFEILRKEC